jgi:uncharacterized membrane protein YtjA (UPF0391 family)
MLARFVQNPKLSLKAEQQTLLWLGKENPPFPLFGVTTMLQMSLLFLVIALIAGALGLFGTQYIASQIAWVLFVVFLIFFVVSLVFGRRTPVP